MTCILWRHALVAVSEGMRAVLGQSEIQRIYRVVDAEFRLTVHFIKLSFVIHRHPSFAMQK